MVSLQKIKEKFGDQWNPKGAPIVQEILSENQRKGDKLKGKNLKVYSSIIIFS